MTIPIWAPFAALFFLCSIYPTPRWMRRVDWFCVVVWSLILGFLGLFWFDVALVAGWAAS